MFMVDRFKQKCREVGVSQTKLFALVGKPAYYSSDLKRLKSVPDAYVSVWAKELKTSVAYLNGETDDDRPEEQTKKDTTQYTLSDVMNMAEQMKDAIPSMSPEQIADMYALWIMRGYIDNPSTSDE